MCENAVRQFQPNLRSTSTLSPLLSPLSNLPSPNSPFIPTMAECLQYGNAPTPSPSVGSKVTTLASTQSGSVDKSSKIGRKSRFFQAEDLIIAQEVAAAKVHIPPHGATLAWFEKAAEKANENPSFKHKVTGKNVQGRFRKLLDDLSKRDAKHKVLSGVGGEIEELDEMLGDLLEAKKDAQTIKDGAAKDPSEQ